MSMNTQRSKFYVIGHAEVRVLCQWAHRGQSLTLLDIQRLESHLSGHTDRRQSICHWAHKGQNFLSLDTPTGVRVYVTGHIDRCQSYVTGHTEVRIFCH